MANFYGTKQSVHKFVIYFFWWEDNLKWWSIGFYGSKQFQTSERADPNSPNESQISCHPLAKENHNLCHQKSSLATNPTLFYIKLMINVSISASALQFQTFKFLNTKPKQTTSLGCQTADVFRFDDRFELGRLQLRWPQRISVLGLRCCVAVCSSSSQGNHTVCIIVILYVLY